MNVVVNQLDGAAVPNKAERQKEMNDILEKCDAHGFRMRVTISKVNEGQDPKNAGGGSIAPGGKIPDDAAAGELDKKALEGEIKEGGFKFWVAKEVKSGGNVINGSTVLNTPCSVCREQSGIDGDARTWAHEMGHGLGLKHDDPGVDEDNLMFRSRRKDDGTAAGANVTKEQCETLHKSFCKRNPSTAKTKEQQAEAPARSKQRTAVDTQADDVFLAGTAADLNYVTLIVDENLFVQGQELVTFDFVLNGQVAPFLNPQYGIRLDLDSDPSTGDFLGTDAFIDLVALAPDLGFFIVFSQPGFVFQSLEPLEIRLTDREITGPVEGSETPHGTILTGQIERQALELIRPVASQIEFLASADLGLFADVVGPERVETFFDDVPGLRLFPDVANTPGQQIFIEGFNFEPNTTYELLFADQPVGTGTTNSAGEIFDQFRLPQEQPGDHLVDAITEAGSTGIAVLRLE